MYFSFFKLKKWGKKDGCGSQTQLHGVALNETHRKGADG